VTVLLLALDTSGAAITVALHDGRAVLAERSVPDARRHAELLAPTIEATLAQAGTDRARLTGIVVGVGPGPFTGLRVGLVTARVLGATLSLPVHGICSLDGLAADAELTGDFLVATDARRREVHWARYRREPSSPGWVAAVRIEGPQVGRPDDVPRHGLPVVGRGAALYPDALGPAHDPLDVRAGALAGLAAAALQPDADAATRTLLLPPDPLYLRRPDAAEPGPRKRVLR
jgi:tRNA threonylcarbamoyl adenosine modification protein YeaZ